MNKATEPEIDDTVRACPDCETPNQFGELCSRCIEERDNIGAEIAEHGDNSPGGSLKSDCIHDAGEFGTFDNVTGVCWVCGSNSLGSAESHNIRQYMKSGLACEKDVNNSPEPFPSILESAEQERREQRKLEFIRQSICGALEA